VVEADLILALQSGGITGAGIDNMPLDKAAHAVERCAGAEEEIETN